MKNHSKFLKGGSTVLSMQSEPFVFVPCWAAQQLQDSFVDQATDGTRMNGNSGQFMISQFEAEADDDEIEMVSTTMACALGLPTLVR